MKTVKVEHRQSIQSALAGQGFEVDGGGGPGDDSYAEIFYYDPKEDKEYHLTIVRRFDGQK